MSSFNLLSCYGNAKRKVVSEKVSVKSFIESLKVVLEFLDQQMGNVEGIESLKTTFTEVVAIEVRKAIENVEDNEEIKSDDGVNLELEDAKREIDSKRKHIEQLEQLIQELQASLRVEVDRPVFEKLNLTGDTFHTTTGSIDEIDGLTMKLPNRFTLKQRLSNLFKSNNIGIDTPSVSKSEISQTSATKPLEIQPEHVDWTPDDSGKRKVKKLIHFNSASTNTIENVHRRGLNDFDDFY